MKRRWVARLCYLCVSLLILAGCASEKTTAAPAASSERTTEAQDSLPTTGSSTTTATTAPPTSSTDTTADAEAGDPSPPTTGTDGLAAPIEPTSAPPTLECERIEDFGDDSLGRWMVVNDGVMGGRSVGGLQQDGGVVRFAGTINTNGGGFSLIRTATLRSGQPLREALSQAAYLQFRIRSANGRGYELIAEDSSSPSQVMHFAPISVDDSGDWAEVAVPLTDLEARAFGNPRIDVAPFSLDEVTSVGVILADGLDGPFSLEIDRLIACR